MTPEEMALALVLIATPASAETFAERWPRPLAVESGTLVDKPAENSAQVAQVLNLPPGYRRHSNERQKINMRDICALHHMHKVVTRGGKSWRCQK